MSIKQDMLSFMIAHD